MKTGIAYGLLQNQYFHHNEGFRSLISSWTGEGHQFCGRVQGPLPVRYGAVIGHLQTGRAGVLHRVPRIELFHIGLEPSSQRANMVECRDSKHTPLLRDLLGDGGRRFFCK
jgi:hypothetical protein